MSPSTPTTRLARLLFCGRDHSAALEHVRRVRPRGLGKIVLLEDRQRRGELVLGHEDIEPQVAGLFVLHLRRIEARGLQEDQYLIGGALDLLMSDGLLSTSAEESRAGKQRKRDKARRVHGYGA